VATFPRRRQVTAIERSVLLTVADLASLAFERALAAEMRSRAAALLHEALLPSSPPPLCGVEVACRYLPAAGETTVGGDWYDVMTLAADDLAVVVGDVVGHGATAAAVMGRLRSALAALLLAGQSPAQSLESLDRYTHLVDGALLSTAVCLRLDPRSGSITYSSAGHPPPLLITEGGTAYLREAHAPALGINASNRRTVATSVAPAGATLLVYTDGLVERRGGATIDEGLARLATAAAQVRPAPLPALVDGVLDRMLDGHRPTDDVAVVGIRFAGSR
jgi:serine phosphatase RsbU (regulator of sigma subunit)